MGTDAQESWGLICRSSCKPMFHCQAQLVSNRASRPWQRGFPITPDHTEEREAGREGPKAASPHLVLVPFHLTQKLEDGDNRK